MTSRLRGAALAAMLAAMALGPARAAAFALTTCSLTVTATNYNGDVISTATGGMPDGTLDHPLLVDWDGTVSWHGTSGSRPFRNNSWHVDVFMLPTPLRGGDANSGGTITDDGSTTPADSSPFRVAGLYYVSGIFSGDGGSCEGSGWVKLQGNPATTVPLWLSIAVGLVGAALVWFSLRGGRPWAIVGGILAGIGLALVLIMVSLMPLGAWTPLGALALGVLVGLVVAILGSRIVTARPRVTAA